MNHLQIRKKNEKKFNLKYKFKKENVLNKKRTNSVELCSLLPLLFCTKI